MNVVEIISKLPVLQEIDRGQAEEIAAHFSEARYAAGEVLHREQERRELLIIIQEGTVEVRKQLGAKPEVPLITYGPGDVLAEAVLLEDTEHSTSAVARTPVTALVAPGDKLRAIMDEDLPLKAHVYRRIIDGLTQRLGRLAPQSAPDALDLIPGNARTEQDLLGPRDVPADAYFGVQTSRALENFQITGVPISLYPDFVAAFAMVKIASAKGNRDCGVITPEVCDGIVAAAEEIIPNRKALAIPGRIRGSVTFTSVPQRLARMVSDASSIAGLIEASMPLMTI